MMTLGRCIQTCLLLAAATLSARAGTFNNDFNSGALPPGTHTNATGSGGAYLELTGGIGDSGCLKLTKAINSQSGSFILDDLDAGSPIYGFDVTFKIRIGGGGATPADGMSLCVAPDLSDTSLFGEVGAGSGLRFNWATYPFSGQTPPDPAIRVRTGETIRAWKGYTAATLSTGGTDPATWWADVHIRLNADGSLNFDYKGENVLTNFFVPGYQDFVNSGAPERFGFGARTGGANDNFWVDNLQITTFTTPLAGISQQPFSQTVQQGDDAAFDARVANINGVTYQWLSNNVAIAGSVSQSLIITNVQPAFSGSQYKVIATGPNNSVTSSVVTLTVTNLTLPAAQLSFDFNDGLTPVGAAITGSAIVDTTGGVANSGVVKLVAPTGSGALIVTNSAEAGLPVFGFTARFKILVGGGTVPPADGFAFAFGNDIPDAPGGDFESGAGLGNGLLVTFDIYDNSGIFGYSGGEGAQPAPSIDVRFGGQVLGTVRLPISFMETGVNDDLTPRYQDTIVQLNTDGTLNVVYHGALVFDHLPVPAFTSVTGGRFAIAARTGGLNDNIWVDNFQLTSVTTPGAIRITTQPVSQTILVNHALTNTVAVNDTAGVTYQWLRSGTNITGATSSSYVLSPVTVPDSSSTFNVQVTKASVTVTSSVVTLTVANLTAPVSPNLTFNFNDGLLPATTAIYSSAGGGYITASGGVGDSGVLHITDAANGQQGAFVVSNLFNGAQVSAIAVSFDLRLGGGSGNAADGVSFNFAPNLTAGVAGGQEGNGTGISVVFDIYDNGNETPPAPSIDVRYKGSVVASTQVPKPQLETGSDFRTVLLRVDPDGKLYLSYGERVLYNGLQLPNYTFTAAGRFGFYGATGGENENQWVDNLLIKGTQSTGPLSVTVQPADAAVITGSTASFSVTLSDPNGATYQWQKQSPGGSFTNIPLATASSYTTPATILADNGALFRVNATGPSGSTSSGNALLTVVAPITITGPGVIYDFNDGLVPAGTILNGSAGGGYITADGGVTNSGVLHLTDNINGQGGTFIMPDFNNNAPVKAITAYFAVRVGNGSARPADGFSFVWASSNDIPATTIFSENGIGGGLIVGFDIYDNSGEAPSFNVVYHTVNVASKLVPYSAIETGDVFGNVFIRVNADGTLDLQYNGQSIFNHLVLPGYTPLVGGEFALGARTGGENANQWVDNIAIVATVGVNQPPLGFSRSGNTLTLSWGAGFKLQSTGRLTPPVTWNDVVGAASPYPAATATGTNQFFRLINLP